MSIDAMKLPNWRGWIRKCDTCKNSFRAMNHDQRTCPGCALQDAILRRMEKRHEQAKP